MAIIKNTLNNIVLHYTANSGNVVVQGNSSVSGIAFGNSTVFQNVSAASIRKIACSSNSATAAWTVKRNANVVWVASGNFLWDFAGHNMPLNQDAVANLVVELSGGSGSILIELSKESV